MVESPVKDRTATEAAWGDEEALATKIFVEFAFVDDDDEVVAARARRYATVEEDRSIGGLFLKGCKLKLYDRVLAKLSALVGSSSTRYELAREE